MIERPTPQPRSILTLTVNGERMVVRDSPLATLAATLRDHLGLTGTKIACNAGDCGACTVLVGGKPAMSCQMPLAKVHGDATTIEGLTGPVADALRSAFVEESAFQCGYCASGQIMVCYDLISRSEHLSDAQLAALLSGNICRCTGYSGILRAVRHAAQTLVGLS